MKKLFTNEILINADKETVQQFLLQATNLLKWNWAIGTVEEIRPNIYFIQRNVEAVNQTATVEIRSEGEKVIFESTQGKLEYLFVFELSNVNGLTRVKETFYPTNNTNLPLVLLAPIAKNAFNKNLAALKSILELNITKM